MKANRDNERIIMTEISHGNISITKHGDVFNKKTSRQIGYVSTNGYKSFGIKHNRVVIHALVHRIMYLLFIGDLLPNEQVNHIDGNKLNNTLINFEKVTNSQNVIHAVSIGLYNNAKIKLRKRFSGEKGSSAKLTNQQANEIRKYFEAGTKPRVLSKMFGIHKSSVSRIINSKSYLITS